MVCQEKMRGVQAFTSHLEPLKGRLSMSAMDAKGPIVHLDRRRAHDKKLVCDKLG